MTLHEGRAERPDGEVPDGVEEVEDERSEEQGSVQTAFLEGGERPVPPPEGGIEDDGEQPEEPEDVGVVGPQRPAQPARGGAVGVPVVLEVREDAPGQARPCDLLEVGVEGHTVRLVGGRVHETLVVHDHALGEDLDAHALALLAERLRGGRLLAWEDMAHVLGRVPRQLGEDGVHDLAAAPPLVVHGAVLVVAARQRHVARRVLDLPQQPVHPVAGVGGAVLRQDAPARVVAPVEGLGVLVDALVGVRLLAPLEPRARRRRQHVEDAGRDGHAHLEVPGHGEDRVHLLPEDGPVVAHGAPPAQRHQHEERLEHEHRLPRQVVHGVPEILGDETTLERQARDLATAFLADESCGVG